MNDYLQKVVARIEQMDPLHAKKIKKNLCGFDEKYYEYAGYFLEKLSRILEGSGKDLDYVVDCYMKVVDETFYEQMRFLQTGEYSCKSFKEAQERVYANPGVMNYYMYGLLLSQFLWRQHYEAFVFFKRILAKYRNFINSYLEIGAGHGLYTSEAINCLTKNIRFDVVDISPASLALTNTFVDSLKVNYVLSDIFNYEPAKKYDFIMLGEVLEHVEDPVALIKKLRSLLSDTGLAVITTAANAPAIDHIFLFHDVDHIHEVIKMADLRILEEHYFYVEDVPEPKAKKLKIPLMFCAALKI